MNQSLLSLSSNNIKPLKKRFTCSGCDAEFATKQHIKSHMAKKNRCCSSNIELNVIETMFTSCPFCLDQIKTITNKNFMKEHLKECIFKDQHINSVIQLDQSTTINNTFNIINLNSYSNPNMDCLQYNPKLITNRAYIYKSIYFNKDYPENNSILFDSENNVIRLYDNNEKYSTVKLDELQDKISTPLDRAQDYLLRTGIDDQDEFKKIDNLITETYSEEERKNRDKYIQITIDHKKIPEDTKRKIEEIKKSRTLPQPQLMIQ